MHLWVIAPLLFIALQPGQAPKKEKPKLDPARLVGTWHFLSGTRWGMKLPNERLVGRVIITSDSFTVPAGPEGTYLMTYTLNTEVKPATIDLTIKDGPVKLGMAHGLIELRGDELHLCYVSLEKPTDKRPAKMESTRANKAFYFILKRLPATPTHP